MGRSSKRRKRRKKKGTHLGAPKATRRSGKILRPPDTTPPLVTISKDRKAEIERLAAELD